MKKAPVVTVLMPVYNAEKYLREAVESILGQTFKDFEFLIIDDGSADNSLQIIRSYRDPRIQLIVHKKNKKLIATLNEGIQKARAPLVARMDADDVSALCRLEYQVQFMEVHPEVVLVGSDIELIDPEGRLVLYEPAFTDDSTIRLAMTTTNAFAHGSVMFRRSSVLRVGGYSRQAYLVEDYDLWVRLSRVGKVANLPEPLYQWRLNPVGESHSKSQQQQAAAARVAEGAWRSYGPRGPAPHIIWKSIWQAVSERSIFLPERRRRMASLHINLARGYYQRHKRLIALQHVIGSLFITPFFPPLYFYLLMAVLPVPWFFALERFGLSFMRRVRGF